jgi:hypothetical protein
MKKETFSISIEKETKLKLLDFSKNSNKSLAEIVRILIDKGLEKSNSEQILEEKLKKFKDDLEGKLKKTKDDLSGNNSNKFKLLTSEITKNQTILANMIDEINHKVDTFVDDNKALSNINEAKIEKVDTNIRSLKTQITNVFSDLLKMITESLIHKKTVEDVNNNSLRIRLILSTVILNFILKDVTEKNKFKTMLQDAYKKKGLE